MRIGTVDISDYNAKLLSFTYTPASVSNTTVIPYNSMFPVLTDTEISPGKLTVVLHFRGDSIAACEANISAIMLLLYRQSEIELDDEYVYRCTFTSFTPTRRMDTLIEISVVLSAVRHKAIVTIPLAEGDNIVSCSSIIPTQCRLVIVPTEDADSCTVFGITINGLTGGKEIIIDGMIGLITEDGNSKFMDTDLTNFPMLHPGENSVIVTGAVTVNLQYYPTYL